MILDHKKLKNCRYLFSSRNLISATLILRQEEIINLTIRAMNLINLKTENHKNIAFGSRLLSSTYVMINYKKERLFDRFGLQAGFSLIHYSNANVKAPNSSINSLTFNVGITYSLDEQELEYQNTFDDNEEKFTQPMKYNFAFRSGVNESDVVGSGQFPFYIFSAYADKRINHKSAFQFGTDVFFSNFLKFLKSEFTILFTFEILAWCNLKIT